MRYLPIGISGAILAAAVPVFGFHIGSAARTTTRIAAAAPADRAVVEKIVHDYLISNPEVLAEAQIALQAKNEAAQKAQESKIIAAQSQAIFHSPEDAVFGNRDGDVTLVEFFDYNCPYCKHAFSDMSALLAGDKTLRVALKAFPILGDDSARAHVVAEAFRKLMPDKYLEFHRRLLGSRSRADEHSAINVALSLGADEAKLREAMKSPEIMKIFQANYALAGKLNITGTPSYVVGDELLFGARGLDTLAQKIANMRNCQHATC